MATAEEGVGHQTSIKQAPSPKTVQELESFLGMINYYGKFIPNLSSIAAPLNQLRHKTSHGNGKVKKKKHFSS